MGRPLDSDLWRGTVQAALRFFARAMKSFEYSDRSFHRRVFTKLALGKELLLMSLWQQEEE
jgi:hypothetical protein